MGRFIGMVVGCGLFFSACPGHAFAQEPLRVVVLGNRHLSWEPIVVQVINESNQTLTLAPVALVSKKDQIRTRLPIDVERLTGKEWVRAQPAFEGHGGLPPSEAKPGAKVELQLGIVGPGEYRIRVWYLVEPGTPSPPLHPPKFASVVSSSFQVTSSN